MQLNYRCKRIRKSDFEAKNKTATTYLVPGTNTQIQIDTGSDAIGHIVLSKVNQVWQRIGGDRSSGRGVGTGTVIIATGATGDNGGRAVGRGRGVLRRKRLQWRKLEFNRKQM